MHRELLPHQILTRDNSDKFALMCYTLYSSIIDNKKTEEETEQTEKVYEEGYDKEGYDGDGYNK